MRIVALDPGAAKWLRPRLAQLHLTGVPIEVLFERPDDPQEIIAKRAWSMRNATCLVYHGQRLDFASRIYCERLQTQGVRLVDLNDFENRRLEKHRGMTGE